MLTVKARMSAARLRVVNDIVTTLVISCFSLISLYSNLTLTLRHWASMQTA